MLHHWCPALVRVLFCSGSVCAVVHALTDPFFRVPSLDPFTPVLRSSSLAVCGVAVRFDLPRMLCLVRSVPAPAAYLLLVEPTSRVPLCLDRLPRPRLVSWQRVFSSPHHLDTGPRSGPAARHPVPDLVISTTPGPRRIDVLSPTLVRLLHIHLYPRFSPTSSANRIPERFSPGTFDYFFASHQIFHFFVVAAALAHYASVLTAFGHWHRRLGECPAPMLA